MANHKFKVGQIVEPASGLAKSETSSRYEIVSLLPSEGTEATYRVKFQNGARERVVKESQMVLVAEAPVKPARPSIAISGSKKR
jgi:hypothetical protein